jgi:hypothetical protein
MSRSLSMPEALSMPHAGNESPGDRSRLGAPDGPATALAWTVGIRALIFFVGVMSIATAAGRLDYENSSGIPWIAYDSKAYYHIAEQGYATTRDAHDFELIAFFPVYPFVSRFIAELFPIGLPNAMILFSNACSLAAFVVFYFWVRELTNSARIALISVLILATLPAAVFFSAAMTEGPFFLLVATSLLLLQKQKLWWAAGVCGLSTLLRPTGVALAATLALYALVYSTHLPVVRRWGRAFLVGLLASTGGIAYGLFLIARFQTHDAYFQAQKYWEIGEARSIQIQAEQGGPARYSFPWFVERAQRPQAWNRVMALAFVIIMTIGFFKPGPMPRVLFMLPLIIFLMTFLPNKGLRSSSIIRYETAGLPVIVLLSIWLSKLDRKPMLTALLLAQFALQAYYAVLYSRGIWIG